MCLFAETGWGAGQRGGVGDLMGRRARKTGGCKKEQRTFVSCLQSSFVVLRDSVSLPLWPVCISVVLAWRMKDLNNKQNRMAE